MGVHLPCSLFPASFPATWASDKIYLLNRVFTSLNWLCFSDKSTPCSFILSRVMVCCDWPDLGHVPLLCPGAGSVSRNSQRRASGQPGRISPLIHHTTQASTIQAGNVQLLIVGYRNHSNIVLFALPGLVSCQLKKKKVQYLLKFSAPTIVKGTSGCGSSWALGRECPGTFEESGWLHVLEATLTALCPSPVSWL